MSEESTKQVTPPEKRNPTGKGGFGEHPENRSDGRWSKENSFSYWMNLFKSMSVLEFKAWQENNPEDKRSVAADLAFVRVLNSRKDLEEFKVLADRTEGRVTQNVNLSGKVDTGAQSIADTLQSIYNHETPPREEGNNDNPNNEDSD